MGKQFFQFSRVLGAILFLLTLSKPGLAIAAAQLPAEQTDPDWIWNLLITIIVLSVVAGSSLLPISALKHWTGQWRLCAAFPLCMLVIWLGVIGISKLISPDSHPLWSLELFSWAMLTMIYMVTIMTAKRLFEKRDLENIEGE